MVLIVLSSCLLLILVAPLHLKGTASSGKHFYSLFLNGKIFMLFTAILTYISCCVYNNTSQVKTILAICNFCSWNILVAFSSHLFSHAQLFFPLYLVCKIAGAQCVYFCSFLLRKNNYNYLLRMWFAKHLATV